MSDKHLQLKPHAVRGSKKQAWWYEEPNGISVAQQVWSKESFLTVRVAKIPWREIRRALARKDKK